MAGLIIFNAFRFHAGRATFPTRRPYGGNMTDINTVVLVGRLTRDAELKYTKGGTAVMAFSIAVNKSKKEGDQWRDEGHFFDCSMFGKRAESLNQYLTKGMQIAVSGSLEQQRWESKDGARSKIVVIVEELSMLGGKKGEKREKNDDHPDSVPEPVHQIAFEDDEIPF